MVDEKAFEAVTNCDCVCPKCDGRKKIIDQVQCSCECPKGEATMCAVYPDARNPFAFPGTECAELEDWAVSEVWVMLGAEANDLVDITEQLDRKLRALRCHESQHRDPDAMEERVREWWKSIAAERGRPEGTSAEAFRVVDTK